MHFVKKYGRPKSFNIVPVNCIRLFGRQLLETLRFLYDKGFPYGQHKDDCYVIVIINYDDLYQFCCFFNFCLIYIIVVVVFNVDCIVVENDNLQLPAYGAVLILLCGILMTE